MNAPLLFKMAYEQGVKIALDEHDLPEAIAAKEAGVAVETPGMSVERPMHHDVKKGLPASFGAKGREQKHAEEEPDYIAKARDYADRYHKSLLARFKSEHEAKQKPPEPKMAAIGPLIDIVNLGVPSGIGYAIGRNGHMTGTEAQNESDREMSLAPFMLMPGYTGYHYGRQALARSIQEDKGQPNPSKTAGLSGGLAGAGVGALTHGLSGAVGGGLTGATLGGIYGAATGEDGQRGENALKYLGKGGLVGAGVGGGLGLVSGGILGAAMGHGSQELLNQAKQHASEVANLNQDWIKDLNNVRDANLYEAHLRGAGL